MKRIKSIIALVLVALSLCTLFGCGGGNGGGSNSKKSDLETLKNNLQTTIDNLDNVAYDKFYSTYDSEGTLTEDVGYDASGYFYYREYKAENKETTMVYVWVEDNVLTSTYYYKNKSQDPDRRYWVNSYSSYEDAIRKVVSWGGDVDTMGAITGAIAGAYYGIPEEIEKQGLAYLDDAMLDIVDQFKQYVANKNK